MFYFFFLVLQLYLAEPSLLDLWGFSWFVRHGLYLRRDCRNCVSDGFSCGSKGLLWAGVVSTFSDSGYPEIAIGRKDCLENPWIFPLPSVILWEHFGRAGMWEAPLVAWSVSSFLCVWCPKIEAPTKFKRQLFPVQGGSYQWSSNTDPSVLVNTNELFQVCSKHQLRMSHIHKPETL